MRSGRIKIALMTLILSSFGLCWADDDDGAFVYVSQYECLGADGSLQYETIEQAGESFDSFPARSVSGYIFTGWEVHGGYAVTRDVFGRAKEVVSVIPYEDAELWANYLPENIDTDGDGIPDGHELYWYGTLEYDSDSDTDGDGFSFSVELERGTSPVFANVRMPGSILKKAGDMVLLNPYSSTGYIIRSDDGELIGLSTNFVIRGQNAVTPKMSPFQSSFAYWMVDGVPARDVFGRALDRVSVPMGDMAIEFVAVSESDEIRRMKLYWYGTDDIAMDSDTDGDGYTFAEELSNGTNPHFPDERRVGGLNKLCTERILLNPYDFSGWIVVGVDGTTTNIVPSGDIVTSPRFSPLNSEFAFWTVNGIAARDAFGRALDTVVMPKTEEVLEMKAVTESDEISRMKLYWYGTTDILMDSDTDGDGFTFEEELANGTNPHFPDRTYHGAILKKVGDYVNINGQDFEQVKGAIVSGHYIELFTSPVTGNSESSATFGNGGQIWPVVADVNDDRKWDLVVCSATTTNVYLNVGSPGNPEFAVGDVADLVGRVVLNAPDGGLGTSRPTIDLAMNSTAKLASLTLDVAPVNALSATTNGTTLLVSDTEGRIWYYSGESSEDDDQTLNSETLNFKLNHKVWGGSYAGFAEGLMLAAVDWEDDGDLDCICGTADGKLMLLRNPKVGRPTNVKALAGVDNVLLTWDPNAQSRVRGYRVYRGNGEEGNGELGTGNGFTRIAEPPLPTYRDFPGSTGSFDYKVSSVSRFYTVGNSTPTITESPMTEAVRATLGTVKFFWNDVVCKLGENANVMLSIENSLNYNVAGTTQTVTYDPEYLRPLKVAPTEITKNVKFNDSYADGTWTINLERGTLTAGEGMFFTLVFETLKTGTTTVGDATVTISAVENPDDPTEVPPYSLGDVNGDRKIDVEDLRLLAKLKNGNGRKPTANQIKAGDFNGNGKLDNADYQALRALLQEKGLL